MLTNVRKRLQDGRRTSRTRRPWSANGATALKPKDVRGGPQVLRHPGQEGRDRHQRQRANVIPDADLRDAEYIPFSVLGNDVSAGIRPYFDAEVKPHWPDAWINEDVLDASDGQIGVVGCEINFNREFYVYEAPRSRDAIKHDIEAMEQRFMEMLKGVAG